MYRLFRAEISMWEVEKRGGEVFIFISSGLLLVILAVGAWFDIREQRVPNWWCILACAAGVCLTWQTAAGEGSAWPLLLYTARLLVVAAVWFPLFRLRMIGAGDVKLMALIVGFLGFGTGVPVILYGFFIGAVLAFLKMLVCRNLHQRLRYCFAYFRRLFLTGERMPYYEASRDGRTVVIPLGFCLMAGYVMSLLYYGG